MRSKMIIALVLFLLPSCTALAAVKKMALPKKETVEILKDKSGKPAQWIYRRNGERVKTEHDRNHDGKADFRVIERKKRFIRKEYDDDFDGRFEKIQKAPIS